MGSRSIAACVTLALCVAPQGCEGGGESTSPESGSTTSTTTTRASKVPRDQDLAAVCPQIYRRAKALIHGVVPKPLGPLKHDQVRSLNFSGCELGRNGVVNVHVTLDTAPEVGRRYDNRITEAEQFSSTNRKLFPVPVGGVGDRHVGGGGANWLAVFHQLLSIRGAHLLAIDFYLRGASLPVTKQTAAKLALTTWGLLGVPRR